MQNLKALPPAGYFQKLIALLGRRDKRVALYPRLAGILLEPVVETADAGDRPGGPETSHAIVVLEDFLAVVLRRRVGLQGKVLTVPLGVGDVPDRLVQRDLFKTVLPFRKQRGHVSAAGNEKVPLAS